MKIQSKLKMATKFNIKKDYANHLFNYLYH